MTEFFSRAGESSAAGAADRLLAQLAAGRFAAAGVVLKLWDGTTAAPLEIKDPLGTATLRDAAALRAIVRAPGRGVAEAYVNGGLAIDGDLDAILERANRSAAPGGALPRTPFAGLLGRRRIGPAEARTNAIGHYDIGNEFFALWLDRDMLYTCAYFETPDATLDDAQRAKLDLVCRKLALRPGERVVDAGCGWGALAIFMAERYGAAVRAYNVSPSQLEFARERAKARGVADRVEFVEDDYRAITGSFDAFVSVGMLETVGPSHYRELGAIASRALGTNGRGLIHSIGRSRPYRTDPWIAKHIFPGSYYPSLSEILEVFEPNGFAVDDVENLRPHYTRTLELWREGFEENAARVREMFSEEFVRKWRLYLAAARAAFATGWLELFQVLFAPTGRDRDLVSRHRRERPAP